MKLSVRHVFPCTVDEFWALFWDPEYDLRLQSGTAVARELLEDRDGADAHVQRWRFVPEQRLPAMIAKIAGTDRLTYDQDTRWDKQTRVLTWRVVPALMSDKVTAAGTLVVRAVPEGVERLVEGNIDVRVTFIGGQIEQAIVRSVEQGYEAAAAATFAMLRERTKT